jgi:CheY-like chemotaxis protein
MSNEYDILHERKILIVDDSPQITSLLSDVFSSCDCSVIAVNSGHAAMIQIQLGQFDLIILDVVMPEPDGWDVLGFMRRVAPEMLAKTILLTGNRYHKETLRSISDTEMACVYKPFDVGQLRRAACEVLDHGAASHAA